VRLLGIAFALLLVAAAAGALEIALHGQREQGALLYGAAAPGSSVTLDGEPVPILPDGRYLIGFDRDAPPALTLTVTAPGGAVQSLPLEIAPRDYDIQRIDGLPPEQVTPPQELLDRIARERESLVAARATLSLTDDWAAGFTWPAEGPITGVYGSQRILNGEPRQPHYGVDVAVPVGTPVTAPAAGVVVLAAEDYFYQGTIVIIDHGLGLMSTLMHLSALKVETGDPVAQGQIVALSGKSGRVTGAHLDWRVSWRSAWIDPAQLVPPRN
jgi:murein DD-endopeptidase MepM/ murein hydrolase activator NlpD